MDTSPNDTQEEDPSQMEQYEEELSDGIMGHMKGPDEPVFDEEE